MIAMTALIGRRAGAHETDQFTVPPDRQFADLGDFFNRWAYEAIDGGVRVANDQIRRAIREHQPRPLIEQLEMPSQVTLSVRSQWPWSVTSIETFETLLASPQMKQKYPGKLVAFGDRFNGAYLTAFGPLDVRTLAHLLFFSSTIKVYGTYVGTDKFGHFTDEGISYYFEYKDARDAGVDERQAIARAVRLGTDGLMSERGLLGLLANGDYANGDLAGNFAGFLFYRNLTEPVVVKGVLRPPMLLRDGPYWKLADHVRADSGFFAWFISDHLDEALNPGYFDEVLRPGLTEGVRRQSAVLLRHYCDNHGEPRPREWFDQKFAELSTYWGIDYGHLGRYDELVSIGRCCFDAVKNAAPMPAPRSDAQVASAVFREPPLWDPALRETAHRFVLNDGAALDLAVREQRAQTVRALLAAGADPNHRDSAGITPLHRASDSPQLASLLIRGGAAVDTTDARGRTPLHWSAEEPGGLATAVLLQHGARVAARDHERRTALHAAALSGNTGAIQALLRHGADPDARDIYGATPLHLAAERGQTEAIRALLDGGASVDPRDQFGCTPLHEAARAGSDQAARLLLDGGARADTADDYGTTPLHLACRRGSLPVVRMLVDHSARVNAGSASGATPLHEAALTGEEALVKLLLDRGARPDARDARGRTPADVARAHHGERIASILQPSGPGGVGR